ncbi:MAG: DUF3450 domain-containing protein [Bacteroides sp.]|nr:DUF3450 domain-containing protein [Bacteroidales bacterium]MBD5317258.1 DUF3450 domain-containing protein [Bacteroides sp.]
MASDLQQRVESLKAKTSMLVQKYAALEAERSRLALQLAESEKAIAQRDRHIAELEGRIANLRSSAVINPDRDDVEMTRSVIAGLVREIDRCILDLTD